MDGSPRSAGKAAACTHGDGRQHWKADDRSATGSKRAEKRHQLVLRPIAPGLHTGRCNLVQHTLLQRQIGIEVNLSGLQLFVAKPHRDH